MKSIPFGKPIIKKNINKVLEKIIKSGLLVHGPYQKKFERSFSEINKSKFVTTVSNCTSGMLLYYFCKKLKKNDEVLMPATTHVATANAIEATGAKPIFVDVNIQDGNINLDEAKKKITKNTRGIVVVHYLGFPVDIEKLSYFKKKKLFIVEDCALSLLSSFKNKYVGNFGDCASFSFYPVKHITTGEGGMVILNNKKDYQKILSLKSFGYFHPYKKNRARYNYDVKDCGLNFRLNEISCALGEYQLKEIKKIKEIRKKNFFYAKKLFHKIDGISVLEKKDSKIDPNYYAISIIFKEKSKQFRDKFIEKLKNKGIGSSVYYPKPVPEMLYYKKKYKIKEKFNNSKKISYNSIVLPISQHISKNDIDYIFKSFKKIFYEK